MSFNGLFIGTLVRYLCLKLRCTSAAVPSKLPRVTLLNSSDFNPQAILYECLAELGTCRKMWRNLGVGSYLEGSESAERKRLSGSKGVHTWMLTEGACLVQLGVKCLFYLTGAARLCLGVSLAQLAVSWGPKPKKLNGHTCVPES
eukprot:3046751-Amphidinium_carterae.3